MKVQMKDNLIMRYQLCGDFNYMHDGLNDGMPNELIAIKKIHGYMDYFKTKEFLKSIEGKVVELVFTCGDAFEKEDNDHCLPNELWKAC